MAYDKAKFRNRYLELGFRTQQELLDTRHTNTEFRGVSRQTMNEFLIGNYVSDDSIERIARMLEWSREELLERLKVDTEPETTRNLDELPPVLGECLNYYGIVIPAEHKHRLYIERKVRLLNQEGEPTDTVVDAETIVKEGTNLLMVGSRNGKTRFFEELTIKAHPYNNFPIPIRIDLRPSLMRHEEKFKAQTPEVFGKKVIRWGIDMHSHHRQRLTEEEFDDHAFLFLFDNVDPSDYFLILELVWFIQRRQHLYHKNNQEDQFVINLETVSLDKKTSESFPPIFEVGILEPLTMAETNKLLDNEFEQRKLKSFDPDPKIDRRLREHCRNPWVMRKALSLYQTFAKGGLKLPEDEFEKFTLWSKNY